MAMKRVHLTFNKELIRQPVLWQVGQEFHLVMNIRRADIQAEIGWVELEMEGDAADIEKALEDFRQRGVRIDPITVPPQSA